MAGWAALASGRQLHLQAGQHGRAQAGVDAALRQHVVDELRRHRRHVDKVEAREGAEAAQRGVDPGGVRRGAVRHAVLVSLQLRVQQLHKAAVHGHEVRVAQVVRRADCHRLLCQRLLNLSHLVLGGSLALLRLRGVARHPGLVRAAVRRLQRRRRGAHRIARLHRCRARLHQRRVDGGEVGPLVAGARYHLVGAVGQGLHGEPLLQLVIHRLHARALEHPAHDRAPLDQAHAHEAVDGDGGPLGRV
mmetsp:Transcript_15866/g.40310  ORF Transcript_15866/g.40310 Transcript_15866/m.40310 type:complete len:247 (-) Transcript_15866:46-786(-)